MPTYKVKVTIHKEEDLFFEVKTSDESDAYNKVYDLAWDECRKRADGHWSFDHKYDMNATKIAEDPPED